MLTFLITLSLVLSSFASQCKRVASLSVSLSGPATNVTSIGDLKFTATVTNTGQDLEVTVSLEDIVDSALWLYLLDNRLLSIMSYRPSLTLRQLVWGRSYLCLLRPSRRPVQRLDSQMLRVLIMFPCPPATWTCTSLVRVLEKQGLPVLDARAVDICASSYQKSFVFASYIEAKSLASIASSYISTNGANSLYTAYYGSHIDVHNSQGVQQRCKRSIPLKDLSCTDTFRACSSGVIAYTVISATTIYFCSLFFSEVLSTDLSWNECCVS
ncbi:hypothetical protein EDD85DRAFT_932863 [Armillaria nabsnona]|nr:hypothetical protein EDD85DRAFT_932863 [Armillaria nabsnona]